MNTTNISSDRNLFVATLNTVPACQMQAGDTDWFPAVDVTEAGPEYVFEVDLPGLKPDQIQLRVDSNGLSISGQRVPKHPGGELLRVERPSGAFVRHLPLPADAHGEIHTLFRDGVLELHVPRTCPDSELEPTPALAHEPEEAAP